MYEKFINWMSDIGLSALGRFIPFVLLLIVWIRKKAKAK